MTAHIKMLKLLMAAESSVNTLRYFTLFVLWNLPLDPASALNILIGINNQSNRIIVFYNKHRRVLRLNKKEVKPYKLNIL